MEVIIIMKSILRYLKVFILVFISIVILYYLDFLFHSRLHIIVANKLRTNFSHWYFYEFLFFTIFDFCFAFIGFLAIKFYKSSKHHSEDLMFAFSIPALFPLFLLGVSLISRHFSKPCFVPQYDTNENIIVLIGIIIHWLYAILFMLYVIINLSKKYIFVFFLEYLIFLVYLFMFYARLVGPVKLPFHIF